MKDILDTLEERTRAWHALGRQGLADAIWADYVSIRFGRTGDPRALDYLYPYLNHAVTETRLTAIDVAAQVFEGRGLKAIDALGYFTKNHDHFICDRAVQVVGAAVADSRDDVILDVLGPYLKHRNQFIRKLALVALGKAAAGQASEKVLAEIRRVAAASGPREDEVDMAIARAFAGRPTEEAYCLVAKPELADRTNTGNQNAVAVLVRGAPDEWYERACREVFEPRLHAEGDTGWMPGVIRRDGIGALCHASPGRGMEPLKRMLHLRGSRCPGHAMMGAAKECFAGADPQTNRGPLIDLARNGDVSAQRIASVCLGKMMIGVEDEETIGVLRQLCDARNKAVRAAALDGLGMAAKSTCDEELRRLCLDRTNDDETAVAALDALGMIYLGSGRADVFEDILKLADLCRGRPVRSKKHCKPLDMCYWATGMLYLGTGSTEPVEFLLDVLALPQVRRMDQYQWTTARALILIEFSEAIVGPKFVY